MNKQSEIIVELTAAVKKYMNKNSTEAIKLDSKFKMPNIPFNDLSMLYVFEKNLENSTYFEQMAIRLSKHAYKDAKESVRQIFEQIMTYSIAKDFTWTGKAQIGGGKKTFS